MSRKTLAILMVLVLAAAALAGCGGDKKAEEPKFPTKAVQLIVPYAAGGGTDAVARGLAKSAEPILKQPITVVNKVGANGATGMSDGFNAAPDGYTVTMITVELGHESGDGRGNLESERFQSCHAAQLRCVGFDCQGGQSPTRLLRNSSRQPKPIPAKLKWEPTPLARSGTCRL